MSSQITFIPSVCKQQTNKKTGEIIEPKFTGKIVLRKAKFNEKYKYLSELGINTDAEGNSVPITETKARLDMIRHAVQISMAHYVSIELTHIATGQVITSIDELEDCDDGDEVLIEVGMLVFSGFRLGNG